MVETSTLPVRTAEVITTILSAAEAESPSGSKSFAVLSNPEFLAEGSAISDLETPDRVLIGGDDPSAIDGHWVPAVTLTSRLTLELCPCGRREPLPSCPQPIKPFRSRKLPSPFADASAAAGESWR